MHIKAAESILAKAKMFADAGAVDKTVELRARAYVLEVQIELLKEKEKQKAKTGK